MLSMNAADPHPALRLCYLKRMQYFIFNQAPLTAIIFRISFSMPAVLYEGMFYGRFEGVFGVDVTHFDFKSLIHNGCCFQSFGKPILYNGISSNSLNNLYKFSRI